MTGTFYYDFSILILLHRDLFSFNFVRFVLFIMFLVNINISKSKIKVLIEGYLRY